MTSHQDEEPKVTGNHCLLFQVHKEEKIGRGGKIPGDWKKGRLQLGTPVRIKNKLWVVKGYKEKEMIEIESPHFGNIKTVHRKQLRSCAIRNLNVNIGQVIANEISVCANTSNNKAPLRHPSLITHLCKIARVDTSAPPFERPRKAIDEAYYRQYCGGKEAAQPVPPRRARRERGQAQSQTSAETHEAEPFQMRDMYMSLIGAQLQSIHRGQVATAEMIVGMYDTPPAHRWTMEEFHNVVDWPEEPVQGGGAEAAEASVREMEKDEADDDDAFEDDEDEEEEEDIEDSSD
ncbi:hypothetical protein LR48_Vigan197s000700 [Vigna angularis]|uniref:Putative plant transposon protein domain-containing protein n=1 Tax=Phaseolus angularis TaxID=3914 RepID=A0A0L9T5I3_PHAAN|nr:hypothetical protein LR48_Vigan197s000700 [Vigna angularis]